MAVNATVKIDTRVGSTQGYAVIAIKAVDEDGASLGPQRLIFAHNGAAFTGTWSDLEPCCGTST